MHKTHRVPYDKNPDIPKLEGKLDMLAFVRDARGVLDEVSYSPSSRPERGEMRFLATKTFRDGVVRLADDSTDSTGRNIFPNNGVRLIVPISNGERAIILAVDSIKDNKGRTSKVLTQSVISGMSDVNPTVTEQASIPIRTGSEVEIEVANHGFVKYVRNVAGEGVTCPELQQAITTDLFSESGQMEEFLFVSKALHALDAQQYHAA